MVEKSHAYIVCIDSDGCAMDTMDVKHQQYFGPLVSKFFTISDEDRFLELWNHINLYSRTRGINRFKGLVKALREHGYSGDIQTLERWVEQTKELSNASLQKEIEQYPQAEDLQQALAWSVAVNEGIKELRGTDRPFEKVKEAFEQIHSFVDIAIVSSANSEAVVDEWTRHGLYPYVWKMFGQEQGSKAHCIELLKEEYPAHNILMIGDSLGDLEAASVNGVHFYPVLFGKEKESWETIASEVVPLFIEQRIHDAEQETYNQLLLNLLS